MGMVNANRYCMTKRNLSPQWPVRRNHAIRLGYVRLLDAAPLIVADSLGFFRDAGLNVRLSREVGWATIRDKLAFGELDVAQALSPLPFVMQLGINVARTEVVTGMVLNCNGNAITLSRQLREDGVDGGDQLRRYIKSGFHPRKLVFGVVSLYSSHHFILCRWLEQHSIDPKVDVIISVLPPEQMVRNLSAQNIDGFCVGEPWNSMAVEEGFGWCPATSDQISAGYPEKVLVATETFNTNYPEDYLAMIRVLHQACAFCDDPTQRAEMLKILSKPEYLNCRPQTLSHAFSGHFPMGFQRESTGAFLRFKGDAVNCPDAKRASLVLEDLRRYVPHVNLELIPKDLVSQVWRESLYHQAMAAAAV